jgi:hypothetical protein
MTGRMKTANIGDRIREELFVTPREYFMLLREAQFKNFRGDDVTEIEASVLDLYECNQNEIRQLMIDFDD